MLTTDDLVRGDNVFFCATGVTDGDLLRGVHYRAGGCTTQSIVMRSKSGTVRMIDGYHRLTKLREYSSVDFDLSDEQLAADPAAARCRRPAGAPTVGEGPWRVSGPTAAGVPVPGSRSCPGWRTVGSGGTCVGRRVVGAGAGASRRWMRPVG